MFAAQGAHDSIAVLALDAQGKLIKTGEIKTKLRDFPAGLALDGRGLLFVVNNTSAGENPLRTTRKETGNKENVSKNCDGQIGSTKSKVSG